MFASWRTGFLLFLLSLMGIVFFILYRDAAEEPAERGDDPVARLWAEAEWSDFRADGPGDGAGAAEQEVDYPEGAVKGELVLRFPDRRSYRAYLAALVEAGYPVYGQIDELLVLRVPAGATARIDPRPYGARPGFTYLVRRPPVPRDISPAALATLRPYGASARELAGGALEGSGEGVLVGILDSGIQAHPQFDATYIVHVDLAGGGVDGPGAAHGTSVASIISGSEGLAPESELLVLRVLDDEGLGNSFDVAAALVQATDMGADVVNLSLGFYTDSPLVREAVGYAASRGVILVAAAGNDALDALPWPAAYPEVLAVTAVDAAGRQALFPNRSGAIDFAAPGVGVRTAGAGGGEVLFSGTSAAAPFVTGTIASLLSVPDGLSAAQKVDLLRRTLDDSGPAGTDPLYGGGIIDWDRIAEAGTPGVVDLALADIHLGAPPPPGGTAAFEITVQNRGTTWLPGAGLEVRVGEGDIQRFPLGSLGVGDVTSRTVYASFPAEGGSLGVAARVGPEPVPGDRRPENDGRGVVFRLPVEGAREAP